jgi:predicted nuclease with RNAse H fold
MDQPHGVIGVVGIDLAAGRGTTEVVSLSLAGLNSMPVFDQSKHQATTTDEEIVAAVVACQPTVIAIDAPLSLPAPVMRSLTALGPHGPEHGSVRSFSNDEHTVALSAPSASPYLRAAERDPIWSRLGIRPFPVSFLGGLTFRAIALLPALRAALPSVPIVEVYPSGSARVLGLLTRSSAATPHLKRPAKTSPLARTALQQALSRHITGLPIVGQDDPEPLGADLLDALLAAFTAVAYLRGTYIAIGDPLEGQIVLPQG